MGITLRLIAPLLAGAALTAGCNRQEADFIKPEVLAEKQIEINKGLKALDEEAKDLIEFVKRCKKSGLPENEIDSTRAQLAHSIWERRKKLQSEAERLVKKL